MSDQNDLLVEQVKMLAGEIAPYRQYPETFGRAVCK